MSNDASYLLPDNLGSIAHVLSSSGANIVTESFAPFGARRNAQTWAADCPCDQLGVIKGLTRRGFTGHEMIGGASMGLIHMNGRVQDSLTGRFLSADPFVQDPYDSQSFNRYSYVGNNPLTFTDPSGFLKFTCTTSGGQGTGGIADTNNSGSGGCFVDFDGYANPGVHVITTLAVDRTPRRPPTGEISPPNAALVDATVGGMRFANTGGGNAIGVLSGGVAYIVYDELVGDYSCAKIGKCQTRLAVRPDCNVLPAYKHNSCEAVYPSAAIENTFIAGLSAFSLIRAAIAANTPEAVIARIAQGHANSGREALAAYMSAKELAAVQTGSRATPAIMGQAVHNATAQSLAEIYPGKYLYFPRAPYDFIHVPTGQVFELTTFGEAGSHAARGADLILYTLPK